ncbi:DUF3634 family protein [Polyangium aurulentum]|uniref:DUF3634 family protein n=1 Tax=Polyangium aurulentum TaxID=2567896 RepID=UPI0010AEA9F7|nr:DUF3634 family protein [Polyangium aurulentum]UQA60944.1 DUF3634 family protein [Polyangium aurulentum]
MPSWLLVGAAAFVLFALWMLARGNELFHVSARDGRVLLVRGRIPPSLLTGFGEIVQRAGVRRATIRAVKEGGGARLVASGVDENTAQRLRNAFGVHPIQRLRTAPFAGDRNLGQVLGFAWLAWLLAGPGGRRDA